MLSKVPPEYIRTDNEENTPMHVFATHAHHCHDVLTHCAAHLAHWLGWLI
jgi:hypothetical protein